MLPLFFSILPLIVSPISAAPSGLPTKPSVNTNGLGFHVPLMKGVFQATNVDGTFNFPAVSDHLQAVQEKYAASLNALRLNATESPDAEDGGEQSGELINQASGSSPSSDGGARRRTRRQYSEGLKDQAALLWYGWISIGGNGGQRFMVDFDTGSSDLWVPSVDCKSQTCRKKKHHYDASKSSTSRKHDGSFSIQYGDQSATSGPILSDTVNVAGADATNQYFSAVTSMSRSFGNDVTDGIMGLAYSSISQLGKPNFVTMLKNQGKIIRNQFSFRLSRDNSELYIGGANSAMYTGSIELHPVQLKAFHNLSSSVYLNNDHIQAMNAIIDTGTSVIVAPSVEAEAFWYQVPGSSQYENTGFYTFPCGRVPSVTFTFNDGKNWAIDPSLFNLGKTSVGSSRCVGAVVGMDVLGDGNWILGNTFLAGLYTIFDLDYDTVGFAALS